MTTNKKFIRFFKPTPNLTPTANNNFVSDVLNDYKTTGNTLSIYEVKDDFDIDRIIANFSLLKKGGFCKKNKYDKISYFVFDQLSFDDLFCKLGVSIKSDFTHPLLDFSVQNLHYNISNLQTDTLEQCILYFINFLKNGTNLTANEVTSTIQKSLSNNHLNFKTHPVSFPEESIKSNNDIILTIGFNDYISKYYPDLINKIQY